MLSTLLAGSCSDFLDRENEDKVLAENYWNSVEDCEMVLNAVYNAFKQENIYALKDEALRTDMAICGTNNRVAKDDAALHTFNDAFSTVKTKWAALYEGIFYANQVIEGCEVVREKLTLDSQLTSLDQIQAQAYFFRGLFYFWLSDQFNDGSVPIIDYVPVNMPDDLYQPLSTPEEVRLFIRKDVNTALSLGMVDKWTSNTDNGRATAMAAYTLLGMSYLYEQDYKSARYYFELVVNSPDYELIDSNDHATTSNELSAESILEATYTLDINSQYSGDSSLYNGYGMIVSKVDGWCSIVPALWLVNEYTLDPVDAMNEDNWIDVEFDTYDDGDDTNDETPDIIYKHLGETVGTSSSSSATYLVYRYSSSTFAEKETDAMKARFTGLTVQNYGTVLWKKTVDLSNDPSDSDFEEPEYEQFTTSGCPYQTPYYIFWNSARSEWFHLRDYSYRASYSIAINGEVDLPYYQYIPQQSVSYGSGNTAYFRKYSNWDIWYGENEGSVVNKSGINLRVMRLADVYLMYAEALIEGGESELYLSTALEYVNKVRERAGVKLLGTSGEFSGERSYDGVTYSAEDLMEHLMYVERPLELALDGCAMRGSDLRRWGITKQRFEDLTKDWYAYVGVGVPYVEVSDDGSYSTSKKYGYQRPYEEVTDADIVVDYTQAAANYNETVATWPIPAVEKSANPYIN